MPNVRLAVQTALFSDPGGYLRHCPDPENDWYIVLLVALVFAGLLLVVTLQ